MSKIPNLKPDVRYLDEIKQVLYDKEWAKKAKNFPLYYMYRGIKRKGKLRYDITEILPKMLGKEFPKTKGHHHPGKHQELYLVLKGEAFFLLQKNKNEKIEDIYVVKAKKGQGCLIPSGYGHITINPTRKVLKVANWVSEECGHDYSLFEKFQGAGYYYTKRGWIKNKNYATIPTLHFKEPLKSLPKNLDFLKK